MSLDRRPPPTGSASRTAAADPAADSAAPTSSPLDPGRDRMDTQPAPPAPPTLLPPDETLRAHLVRLIVDSSDGGLSAGELATVQGSLRAVGYSSLSFIRLIDGIENELGVYIDPDADIELFDTVDGILGLVAESRDGSGA